MEQTEEEGEGERAIENFKQLVEWMNASFLSYLQVYFFVAKHHFHQKYAMLEDEYRGHLHT